MKKELESLRRSQWIARGVIEAQRWFGTSANEADMTILSGKCKIYRNASNA